jgi:hypothetical protein
MMSRKSINLNGLILSADEPITPRTQSFLSDNHIVATSGMSKVQVSGCFSLSKDSVDAFLARRKSQDAARSRNTAAAPKDDFGNTLEGLKGAFQKR